MMMMMTRARSSDLLVSSFLLTLMISLSLLVAVGAAPTTSKSSKSTSSSTTESDAPVIVGYHYTSEAIGKEMKAKKTLTEAARSRGGYRFLYASPVDKSVIRMTQGVSGMGMNPWVCPITAHPKSQFFEQKKELLPPAATESISHLQAYTKSKGIPATAIIFVKKEQAEAADVHGASASMTFIPDELIPNNHLGLTLDCEPMNTYKPVASPTAPWEKWGISEPKEAPEDKVEENKVPDSKPEDWSWMKQQTQAATPKGEKSQAASSGGKANSVSSEEQPPPPKKQKTG